MLFKELEVVRFIGRVYYDVISVINGNVWFKCVCWCNGFLIY